MKKSVLQKFIVYFVPFLSASGVQPKPKYWCLAASDIMFNHRTEAECGELQWTGRCQEASPQTSLVRWWTTAPWCVQPGGAGHKGCIRQPRGHLPVAAPPATHTYWLSVPARVFKVNVFIATRRITSLYRCKLLYLASSHYRRYQRSRLRWKWFYGTKYFFHLWGVCKKQSTKASQYWTECKTNTLWHQLQFIHYHCTFNISWRGAPLPASCTVPRQLPKDEAHHLLPQLS